MLINCRWKSSLLKKARQRLLPKIEYLRRIRFVWQFSDFRSLGECICNECLRRRHKRRIHNRQFKILGEGLGSTFRCICSLEGALFLVSFWFANIIQSQGLVIGKLIVPFNASNNLVDNPEFHLRDCRIQRTWCFRLSIFEFVRLNNFSLLWGYSEE